MIAVRHLHGAIGRAHFVMAAIVLLVALRFLTSNRSGHRWTEMMWLRRLTASIFLMTIHVVR